MELKQIFLQTCIRGLLLRYFTVSHCTTDEDSAKISFMMMVALQADDVITTLQFSRELNDWALVEVAAYIGKCWHQCLRLSSPQAPCGSSIRDTVVAKQALVGIHNANGVMAAISTEHGGLQASIEMLGDAVWRSLSSTSIR